MDTLQADTVEATLNLGFKCKKKCEFWFSPLMINALNADSRVVYGKEVIITPHIFLNVEPLTPLPKYLLGQSIQPPYDRVRSYLINSDYNLFPFCSSHRLQTEFLIA